MSEYKEKQPRNRSYLAVAAIKLSANQIVEILPQDTVNQLEINYSELMQAKAEYEAKQRNLKDKVSNIFGSAFA